jgi:hypothetical protein
MRRGGWNGGMMSDDQDVLIGMDKAADFIFKQLTKALKLETFDPKDGSESWEGDVSATLYGILYAAKVLNEETNTLRILDAEIFLAGTSAKNEMKPLGANPYNPNTQNNEYFLWREGWLEAHAHVTPGFSRGPFTTSR